MPSGPKVASVSKFCVTAVPSVVKLTVVVLIVNIGCGSATTFTVAPPPNQLVTESMKPKREEPEAVAAVKRPRVVNAMRLMAMTKRREVAIDLNIE